MSLIVVIPARYASTRYPGKPLVPLTGASGHARSLIRRSWDAGMAVAGVDRVVVATDDNRIADHVRGFGAEVVMTPESCRNGTERCAAAMPALEVQDDDVIVNLQGDAPLTPPWFIAGLAAAMTNAEVTTPVLRMDAEALCGFKEDRLAGRVGGTTAVFDHNQTALYFSKEVIPYTGRAFEDGDTIPVFHHVGVYAYRPSALRAYADWSEGTLEKWEGLEQLRFMEHGTPVTCVEVQSQGRAFWELNNPSDVGRIEAILKVQGID
ncbi:MAG: manno-octulosonate cytidylyltransferase [Pseudomonadota bacterium]